MLAAQLACYPLSEDPDEIVEEILITMNNLDDDYTPNWVDDRPQRKPKDDAIDVDSPKPKLPAIVKASKPDQTRLQDLLAPSTLQDKMPRHWQPEGDTFGLFEEEDTYERFLGLAFARTLNLVQHLLPTLGTLAQDAWKQGDRVLLPAKPIGEIHEFRVSACSDSITFLRADSTDTTKGFVVRRLPNGHIVVRDERHGESNPLDDNVYGDMVDKAIRFLDDYSAQFGFTPEYLTQPYIAPEAESKTKKLAKIVSPQEIQARRKQRAEEGPKHGPVRDAIRWLYTDDFKREEAYKGSGRIYKRELELKEKRPLSPGKFSFYALLLPIPFIGSGLWHSGPLSHVPRPWPIEIADDVLNMSEHDRQGYDAKGLHLPEVNSAAAGDTVQVAFVNDLSRKVLSAPFATADNESVQDVHGGTRHLRGLSLFQPEGSSYYLRPNDCEAFKVQLEVGERVRAVNTDPEAGAALAITVRQDAITVCNTSPNNLAANDLRSVYIEVI